MKEERVDTLVSLKLAKHICESHLVDTTPTNFEYHEKFIQFMDDPEIFSFGKWMQANGQAVAATMIKIDLDKLDEYAE